MKKLLDEKDCDGFRAIYCDLYLKHPKKHPNYTNALGHDWDNLEQKNYLIMTDINKEMGQLLLKPLILWACTHEKCKICCKQAKCHHGDNAHEK